MGSLTAAHTFYVLGSIVLGIIAVLLIVFLAYLILIIKIVHGLVRVVQKKMHVLSLKTLKAERGAAQLLAKGYELLPHFFSFLKKRRRPRRRE